MNMTLFFHNEDTKSDGGVEMIKQVGKVISSMISILCSSVLGICHLVVLTSLGLIGVVAGILTCFMPILGLLSTFGMENIFIIWNDIQVPGILGLPTGIFLGIILAGLSWMCFRALLKYFHWISKK